MNADRDRHVALHAGALMVLVALSLSACASPVKLSIIPPDKIPQVIRDSISDFTFRGNKPDNVVWRVCEPKDGRLLAACTFTQEMEPGVRASSYSIWSCEIVQTDGPVLGNVTSSMGTFDEKTAFGGGAGSGMSRSDSGELTYRLEASGYCLDGRVKTIRGTTTEGRTAVTTPSGGFWNLYVKDTSPHESWASVAGLSDKGTAILDLLTPTRRIPVAK